MIRSSVFLAALAVASTPLYAETVYKYTDESGNIVFTDEPTKGAEQLDVKPVPTVPAIPVPKIDTTPAPTDAAFQYDKVTIVIPSDGEHFINNGGQVSVQVALSPKLRKSDKLRLYFNGGAHGEDRRATTFKLDNLDRGEYAAQVAVIDNKGEEVGRSETVTFYIKRSAAPKKSPK